MKKAVMSMIIVGLLSASAFPFKLGLEFQAGEQMVVGANMRFSELFELKPKLGFLFSDPVNLFSLVVDGNFYLPDLGELQHYAGFGVNLAIVSEDDASEFGLDGHYGLRYDINEVVSIFGQVGLGMIFTPDFVMSTYSTGAGVTFFIIND